MQRDNKDSRFDELMDSYESGDVDWDDVEVPNFDRNEDNVLDLNINTDIDSENTDLDDKDARVKFQDLKNQVENVEFDDPNDELQSNPSNNESDPFVYVDKNELEESYNNKEPTKNTNVDNTERLENSMFVDSTKYSIEYVIMEWLQYMVDKSSVTDAYIALEYYSKINWLNDKQKEDIQEYLYGFEGNIDRNRVDKLHTCELNNNDHRKSLKYINILKSSLSEDVLVSRIYP